MFFLFIISIFVFYYFLNLFFSYFYIYYNNFFVYLIYVLYYFHILLYFDRFVLNLLYFVFFLNVLNIFFIFFTVFVSKFILNFQYILFATNVSYQWTENENCVLYGQLEFKVLIYYIYILLIFLIKKMSCIILYSHLPRHLIVYETALSNCHCEHVIMYMSFYVSFLSSLCVIVYDYVCYC